MHQTWDGWVVVRELARPAFPDQECNARVSLRSGTLTSGLSAAVPGTRWLDNAEIFGGIGKAKVVDP